MSIRLKFSLVPGRRIFSGIKWNSQAAELMVKNLAEEMEYSCFQQKRLLVVQMCAEGYLWFQWEKGRYLGESQTNLAGPGFHRAVIEFLEKLADREKLSVRVEDRTGYFLKRDFLAMRQEYFYQWFSDLMELISHWDEGGEPYFCWPGAIYVPECQEGRLITHNRSYSFQEIRNIIHSGMSGAFAKDFFIWNEVEKDARFYRNSALVLLQQFCYFMPSERSAQDSRINKTIIRDLETALSMDRTLPFPQKEYLEVCALDKHNPADLRDTASMGKDFFAGCHKNMVFHKIESMSFAVPGNYLFDPKGKDFMDLYYDGQEYGGHEYYVYLATFENRPAEFKSLWFEQGTRKELLDIDLGEVKVRTAFYEPEKENEKPLYKMSAQALYKAQRLNILLTSRTPIDRDWALKLVKTIKITE